MELIYIYAIIAFAGGFIFAWIIRSFTVVRIKKMNKSLRGFLESEKLRKEILLKENTALHEMKKAVGETYEMKINELQLINKRMDDDILLLQKNNEETESLLEARLPEVHSLKRQLIEANNTIARYKAHLERVEADK